jgi:hypothetical protein
MRSRGAGYLEERVNENSCKNISELPSQERMRDVNTFFFLEKNLKC